MPFILSLMFSLQQNQIQEGGTGSVCGGGRELTQKMYRHVSKCKNDKIRKNVK
jgi:hypothetical protein